MAGQARGWSVVQWYREVDMESDKAEAWSAVWRLAAAGSFASQGDRIEGPALEFWQRQAEGQVDWMVDLACGNGVLSWLFNDLLNGELPRTLITGVDLASISPFRALGRAVEDYPAVRFIGNTALERLPFGDACIDMAVSQYGIEYADLPVAIAEVGRVLKPTARVAFILHDRDGALVQGAIGPIADYRLILEQVEAPGIILELARLCSAPDGGPRSPVTAELYRQLLARLEQTGEAFTSLYRRNADINPVLVYKKKLNQAFGEAVKPAAERQFDVAAFLAAARDAFSSNIQRMEYLAEIAPDAEIRRQLCRLLEQEGFRVTEMAPLHHAAGPVWGTTLTARRGG